WPESSAMCGMPQPKHPGRPDAKRGRLRRIAVHWTGRKDARAGPGGGKTSGSRRAAVRASWVTTPAMGDVIKK
ncbi:MAG TPA: hypothetical protein VIH64_02590, partial [Streptosporangiaceae bacterium]